jgi:hypothetical protein
MRVCVHEYAVPISIVRKPPVDAEMQGAVDRKGAKVTRPYLQYVARSTSGEKNTSRSTEYQSVSFNVRGWASINLELR